MKLKCKHPGWDSVDKTHNQTPCQEEWRHMAIAKGRLSTSDKKAEGVWTQSPPTCPETHQPPPMLSARRVHIQVSCLLSRKPMGLFSKEASGWKHFSWKSKSNPDVTRFSGSFLVWTALFIGGFLHRDIKVWEFSVVPKTPKGSAQSEQSILPIGLTLTMALFGPSKTLSQWASTHQNPETETKSYPVLIHFSIYSWEMSICLPIFRSMSDMKCRTLCERRAAGSAGYYQTRVTHSSRCVHSSPLSQPVEMRRQWTDCVQGWNDVQHFLLYEAVLSHYSIMIVLMLVVTGNSFRF